jgi:hypothetical protein
MLFFKLKKDESIIPRQNKKLEKNSKMFKMIEKLNLENINDKQSLTKLLDLESSCLQPVKASQNNDKREVNQTIEQYIRRLKKVYKGNEYFSPHFQMGYYLKNATTSQLFETFEEYLSSINYTFNASYPLAQFTEQSFSNNYTFQFLFKSQKDVNYARNLMKIYKLLLSDFIEKHKNEIGKHSEQ